jgi:tRNA dimethylallyltransferase
MTRLISIVGPTGTGKSDLGLAMAQALLESGHAAEVVNTDSMQFYRGMNIGTAKLAESERGGFTHHLIDWLEVTDESTAAEYQLKAREVIEGIQSRGAVPILVGGSMLYIAAVLNTFEFPGQDEELRAKLEQELIEVGPGLMHRKLQELDPVAASRIDPLNGRRIVRAIEIVSVTGAPFAASLPDEPESWQPILEIGLNSERAHLVERLNQRVEKMWQLGLVDEVEQLLEHGLREAKTSKRAIGYAQALAQLDGEITQAEAIEQTKLLTARYARRQMSWFRRDKRINWLDYQDLEATSKAIELGRRWVASGEQPTLGE